MSCCNTVILQEHYHLVWNMITQGEQTQIYSVDYTAAGVYMKQIY